MLLAFLDRRTPDHSGVFFTADGKVGRATKTEAFPELFFDRRGLPSLLQERLHLQLKAS